MLIETSLRFAVPASRLTRPSCRRRLGRRGNRRPHRCESAGQCRRRRACGIGRSPASRDWIGPDLRRSKGARAQGHPRNLATVRRGGLIRHSVRPLQVGMGATDHPFRRESVIDCGRTEPRGPLLTSGILVSQPRKHPGIRHYRTLLHWRVCVLLPVQHAYLFSRATPQVSRSPAHTASP